MSEMSASKKTKTMFTPNIGFAENALKLPQFIY